uniref:AB hydrolase-1 domain-containing protein n=1 Tax=Oxyrrhis marina TaxID=2969 RepID=A0A7S4LPR0_OXYMA
MSPASPAVRVALLVGALLVLWRMFRTKKEAKHSITYVKTEARVAAILAETQRRMGGSLAYTPPGWVAPGIVNIGLFCVKSVLLSLFAKYEKQPVPTPDGADISIDWADDDVSRALAPEAPILIVLHTVTGSGPESWHFVREVPQYGWRACVFNRRGCGSSLKTPNFNLMGNPDDTRLMVDAVVQRYPRASFIGMAGISAGSGQIITYLGQEGKKTPVGAGVSLCPAYKLKDAFTLLTQRDPIVDKIVCKSMQQNFLYKGGNRELLEKADPTTFRAAAEATTMQGFFEAAAPFAGASSWEDYVGEHDPMNYEAGIAVPTLLLNAEDDPVCVKENIAWEKCGDNPVYALLVTEGGSHIAYCDGLFGQRQWMTKITMEFLESARAQAEGKLDARGEATPLLP